MKLSKQQQRVYDLLSQRGRVTHRELYQDAYVNYPESVIRDLRKKGIKIKTEPIPNKNYNYYILEDYQLLF